MIPQYIKNKQKIENNTIAISSAITNLNQSGLGNGILPRLVQKELNTLDDFTGFAYLSDCKVSGNYINNGYFLQLSYTSTYKVQFLIGATSGLLQYRKMVNGNWSNFTNV